MSDDVTPWILEAMREARNILFRDDATLTMMDTNKTTLKVFQYDWSLIPPQVANQDITDWVLRLKQQSTLTEDMMNQFAFVVVEDKIFERVWLNPVRRQSSVWIAHVRQVGVT